MLDSIPVSVAVGISLGFLSGLGVGGGTILILWLTQILGMSADTSRIINILFFIAAAGSVSIIRLKKKQIPWRRIMPAIITGCICAWIGTMLTQKIDTMILRKIFGGLLLIAGIKEVLYRDK